MKQDPRFTTVTTSAPVEEILANLTNFAQQTARLGDENREFLDRPLFGTTMYVAECSLDTVFGTFTAYVFQDIIVKNYIVSLARGDIHSAPVLYTRLHSSCVTSETLRGADCDCVQQLEGAFQVIAEKGHGVLFYLIQEGRGTGYVPKARDRMIVQACADKVSTFQAYKLMGLKKDYRDYRNIRDICEILGIPKASWIVLTNNPDKVNAMRELGLSVVGSEALEFSPGPFNLSYLQSKQESGHVLDLVNRAGIASALPPEPVQLFKPFALPHAQRFIYSASYYLPVKPVNDEILMDQATFDTVFPAANPISSYVGDEIVSYRSISGGRYMVTVNEARLLKLRKESPNNPICLLASMPYWFKVHVYYDVVTGLDHVVLTFGKPSEDVPIVRVHSESLFNRFPLSDVHEKKKYMSAISHIVEHGSGVIILLYNDGRGAGFGAHVLDKMLQETHLARSSSVAYQEMGVSYDSRDYEASMILLRHHVPHARIQMIINTASSLVVKPEICNALHQYGLDVQRWIFIDKNSHSS
eukprot:ANDGO_07501.mRNA.1 GTP cyclohydrolase-2